jgi:hypothetical protein
MTTEKRSLWNHPTLDLYQLPQEKIEYRALLYSLPSTFGEEFDNDDHPKPTSTKDLPDIKRWVAGVAVTAIEIFSGKRQPAQLASRCHRVIYAELLRKVGTLTAGARMKSLYLSQPLDGICEATVTVAEGERLRAIVMRCEGVDGRWLCTTLSLL